MSRAAAILTVVNASRADDADLVERYSPQAIKDYVTDVYRQIKTKRLPSGAVDAIKTAKSFTLSKTRRGASGSREVLYMINAQLANGQAFWVGDGPSVLIGDNQKQAEATAREGAEIKVAALKQVGRELRKNESFDLEEGRNAYFDDDAELYSLRDAEIKKVVNSRGDYPMELVGEEADAMAEYVEKNGMGIEQKGGGRRVKYVFTPEALIEFLKAARDGDLEEPLEELAGSIAETMKEYMDESLNEWFTDNQDSAFDVALLLLVNALKAKKHTKIANAITRKFKRNLDKPVALSELADFFEDINYADYSYLCNALEQGADEWRLKALMDLQTMLEKRGAGEFGMTILRVALAGTEREQKTQKDPFSKNLNKVSSDLAKLIKDLPKGFQQELRDEYYLDVEV